MRNIESSEHVEKAEVKQHEREGGSREGEIASSIRQGHIYFLQE